MPTWASLGLLLFFWANCWPTAQGLWQAREPQVPLCPHIAFFANIWWPKPHLPSLACSLLARQTAACLAWRSGAWGSAQPFSCLADTELWLAIFEVPMSAGPRLWRAGWARSERRRLC